MDKSAQALKVSQLLKQAHPNPKTELVHQNEMQLAIAVTLSAQTTDKKVNQITEKLFKTYTSWEDFANAPLDELTEAIKGVNFHI